MLAILDLVLRYGADHPVAIILGPIVVPFVVVFIRGVIGGFRKYQPPPAQSCRQFGSQLKVFWPDDDDQPELPPLDLDL